MTFAKFVADCGCWRRAEGPTSIGRRTTVAAPTSSGDTKENASGTRIARWKAQTPHRLSRASGCGSIRLHHGCWGFPLSRRRCRRVVPGLSGLSSLLCAWFIGSPVSKPARLEVTTSLCSVGGWWPRQAVTSRPGPHCSTRGICRRPG